VPRRAETRAVVDLEAVRERAHEGADPADAISARQTLARALAELAPEDRAAVLLVDANGFDYRSAADILDVPEGTVASRLNRARAALRRALGDTRKGAANR
jgi:RNA polymerase sigma-70 factor, ECF subfamily